MIGMILSTFTILILIALVLAILSLLVNYPLLPVAVILICVALLVPR